MRAVVHLPGEGEQIGLGSSSSVTIKATGKDTEGSFHLSEAVIDVKKGTVASDKPVQISMLNGSLNAQRLDITDNGSVLRFTGVQMTLLPGKETDKNNAEASAKTSDKTTDKAGGQ